MSLVSKDEVGTYAYFVSHVGPRLTLIPKPFSYTHIHVYMYIYVYTHVCNSTYDRSKTCKWDPQQPGTSYSASGVQDLGLGLGSYLWRMPCSVLKQCSAEAL